MPHSFFFDNTFLEGAPYADEGTYKEGLGQVSADL